MTEHFRKLERMYHDAPINEHYEPELTVLEGETELVMPVKESFHHPLGAAHGSVVFKALDDAAFFAANSLVEDVFVLTTDFNLYFERPVSEGEIRAVGEVVNENPNQLVAEAVAYDDAGNELARGSGQFRRSGAELTPDIGYE
ncbi:PaaI family thioesterase [Halospeciosus flavus]|uniref:PaaI family thioesterase n=1 Tax=Halospeciosus flavus TaxID=3032283 RepID=A0ABD5Z8V5_9EURY|nr:PaaI family thioesterase [Halospeciosus flavus]